LQKYLFFFVYDAIHEVIAEKYFRSFSVSIQVFCDYNSSNRAISFNSDQVVSLVMGNLGITQPGASEKRGIVGVQNAVMHDYKSNNVRYAMYVDF